MSCEQSCRALSNCAKCRVFTWSWSQPPLQVRLPAAGYRVVGVASKTHHAWITSELGADAVVDYHDAGYVEQLAADPENKRLAHVFDCVGVSVTPKCFDILETCSGARGVVATVHGRTMQSEAMQAKPEAELQGISEVGHEYESDRFLAGWLDALQQRLISGKLVLNRVRVFEGLEGAKEGLKLVADGKLSGEKAVVHVAA
jgi:NADPH-dependent curcumin reductase CurA